MVAQRNVPEGLQITDEVRKALRENPGSIVEAHAYDCTGEEVGSVEEAHTVVIMVIRNGEVLHESQVEGSPCSAPPRK
jgi:hypothetical protein